MAKEICEVDARVERILVNQELAGETPHIRNVVPLEVTEPRRKYVVALVGAAFLLALTHDTLEFEVARPIASREDAAAMMAVHAHYCSDNKDAYASDVEHAAYLLGAPLWEFWWD